MEFSIRSLSGAVLLILVPAIAAQVPEPAGEGELGAFSKMRILYAGYPGGEREAAFLEFLRFRFEQVSAISLEELDAAAARPYDVVIADWQRRYSGDGNGFDSDRSPPNRIGPDFTRPLVMIGAVAGEIQSHSKIDWL